MITAHTELAEFLAARLDDDERIAMAATGQNAGKPADEPEHWHWECSEDDMDIDPDLAVASGREFLEHDEHWCMSLRSVEQYLTQSVGPLPHMVLSTEEIRPQDARHIAAFGPDRVMRNVKAVRGVLAAWVASDPSLVHSYRPGLSTVYETLYAAVCVHAAVYCDHPGYSAGWIPA